MPLENTFKTNNPLDRIFLMDISRTQLPDGTYDYQGIVVYAPSRNLFFPRESTLDQFSEYYVALNFIDQQIKDLPNIKEEPAVVVNSPVMQELLSHLANAGNPGPRILTN